MKHVNGIRFRTTEDGSICCCSFDGNGHFTMPEPEKMCDNCKQHFADTAASAFAPPDIYSLALRAAAAPSEPKNFEDGWKAERFAALASTRAALDAYAKANPLPRLRAAELAPYVAPDPWAAGIKALQERDARAREAKESR